MRAMATTPPTTPPAIAPALFDPPESELSGLELPPGSEATAVPLVEEAEAAGSSTIRKVFFFI